MDSVSWPWAEIVKQLVAVSEHIGPTAASAAAAPVTLSLPRVLPALSLPWCRGIRPTTGLLRSRGERPGNHQYHSDQAAKQDEKAKTHTKPPAVCSVEICQRSRG